MFASLLLATVIAVPVNHLPVRQSSQPIVLNRGVLRVDTDNRVEISAYCDVKRQPTILVTNNGDSDLVMEWTLTAIQPGYPTDSWSSVSLVPAGKFEGWVTPAPYLHLDIRYDDDGVPKTQSIDASCDFSVLRAASFEK